jgi:DNA-binding MarR family transcriptional regulator
MLLLWEQDGRSVNELGQPLHLDSGTLTPLLKRMEKAGLITRKRDTKDERIMRIHLTDHGHALRERARTIPPAMLCASGLELDGLMALREEVKALDRNLREK